MKKTLLMLAILSLAACKNEKKGNSGPLNAPVDSQAPLSRDSMPADKTTVDQTPDATNDSIVQIPSQDVEQPFDTINEYLYKGLMVFRDNVGEFIDCSNQRVYYVNDRTNELRGKYYSFELPANAPLYVEVVGIYVRPGEKAPKKYKRQMNISHLNAMIKDVPFNCSGALSKIKAN